jgi:hypothetical protein
MRHNDYWTSDGRSSPGTITETHCSVVRRRDPSAFGPAAGQSPALVCRMSWNIKRDVRRPALGQQRFSVGRLSHQLDADILECKSVRIETLGWSSTDA